MRARFEVLSPDEIAELHVRTLKVLGTVGMRVDTAQGRAILKQAGAEVDEATKMVKFPADFVAECLASAPKQFSLGGRRPGFAASLNTGDLALVADGGATTVIDRVTSERREPAPADWWESTKLIDTIDDIGVYWWMIDGGIGNQRPADWVQYWTNLWGAFGKHVQDSFDDPALGPLLMEALQIIFGSAEEVRRIKPFSFLITPVSPLTIEENHTDAWLSLRGLGIPAAIMPMPLMGASAPGSMAGVILTANCDTLGTLCLVQAAEPGAPVIYAPVIATMDPRSGRYAGGGIENAVNSAAGTQMARYYGLPVEASGCGTEHYVPSPQTAYEKAESALLAVLAGPDLVVGPGTTGAATILCFEEIIMDVEMFRMARKAAAGVNAGDDMWLDELLAQVGPCGDFLGERSTRRNARGGEWYLSDFGVHGSYDAWVASGSPTTIEQARVRVEELLASHEPLPLPDDAVRELEKLKRRAEQD
jgi:trimethylamine--corrinoid protein Co-methyltransferase